MRVNGRNGNKMLEVILHYNKTINVFKNYHIQMSFIVWKLAKVGYIKSTSVGAVTDGITALSEEEIKNNETFIETLNTNIGENTDWKSWKKGEDGYPTFE